MPSCPLPPPFFFYLIVTFKINFAIPLKYVKFSSQEELEVNSSIKKKKIQLTTDLESMKY